MAWPPTTHQHVEDAVTSLRGMAQFPTGVYVTAPGSVTPTVAYNVGTICAMPIFLPAGTVSELAVRVTTASTGGGGGTVQLGLYASAASVDATFGRVPGALLATGTAISTETTGVKSLAISQAITGGLYWLAALPLVVASTLAAVGADSLTGRVGSATSMLASNVLSLRRGSQSSPPSPFGTPSGAETAPVRSWCVMSAID